MLARTLKIAGVVLFFFGVGVSLTKFHDEGWSLKIGKLFSSSVLYVTPDTDLHTLLATTEIRHLGWRDLLPVTNQKVLTKYQANSDQAFDVQLSLSLKAATDERYQSALYSTDVVEQVIGQRVSISGYIVPIDLNEDRSIKRFFLVPYYGACIHYPAPPPNQIIYVDLIDGFAKIMMSQAFTLTGVLEKGLFEDHQGTSAYILKVAEIEEYDEQPDEYRTH